MSEFIADYQTKFPHRPMQRPTQDLAKEGYCGLYSLSSVTGSLALAARFSEVACISHELFTRKLRMPVRPKTTGPAVIVKLWNRVQPSTVVDGGVPSY